MEGIGGSGLMGQSNAMQPCARGVPSRLWHPPGLLSLGGLGLRRRDFSGFRHCNAS